MPGSNFRIVLGIFLISLLAPAGALACDYVQNSVDVNSFPVRIDAEVQDWQKADFFEVTENCVSCSDRNSNDLSADFSVTFDEQNLYLIALIGDDEVDVDGSSAIYQLDGIEILLDGFNNCSNELYDDDLMLFVTADGRYQFLNPARANERIRVATRIVKSGYMIEVAIPWHLTGSYPDTTSSIGFSLVVNDRDREKREGQYFWHYSKEHWSNTGQWGSIHFLPQ